MMTSKAKSRHPVIIATGEKTLDQLDFHIPGPIELQWRRRYRSGDARSDGWFGQGWTHPLATEMWVHDDVLRYWDEQGREVVLPAIDVGTQHFQAYEQFTLTRPGPNHWALRHNQGLTHHFRRRHPAQWRLPLEVVQDRNLRRLLLQFGDAEFGEGFDAQGAPPRPRRLIDSAGRTLHLVWTERSQLRQVIVESGETSAVLATYDYSDTADASPDLLSHLDANGNARTFSWDAHLLVGYTLATGERFSNSYDRLSPTGRVIQSAALDEGTSDLFDYNGRTTRVTDALGRVTVYVHNARQDIVAVQDAEGNVTRMVYDDVGRPESNVDALGRSSTTTFDHRGNLTLVMDAAGNATKLEYNALDLPIKLTDATGAQWLRQYDERGNLIAVTDPLGHTTLYELDAWGQVIAIIDALDKRKTLQWDEAGNLVAYTDCSGHTSRLEYDGLGRRRSLTNALGERTSYFYDAAGLLQQITEPDGAEHRYVFDAEGNLVRYVDPLGHATAWKYNGAGAPLLRVDELGHTLGYEYDRGGRLVAFTNEVGARTWFRYDLLDRPTDEVGFDGRHQRYVYNAAGELTHLIESGNSAFGPGKVTRFERDVLGRITAKLHVGESPGQAASCGFSYDAVGRLTEASNAISKVALSYDPLGRLLAETQTLRGEVAEEVFELTHRYDALGNRIQTMLPGGRALNHVFYGSGHLHQINLDGRVISDFERDALHREVKRSQGRLESEFAYNNVGRLSVQRVHPASRGPSETASAMGQANAPLAPPGVDVWRDIHGGAAGLIDRAYRYDLSGRLIEWDDRHRGATQYVYDAADRVIQSRIGVPNDPSLTHGPLSPHGGGFQATSLIEKFRWDAASNPLPAEPGPAAGAQREAVFGNRLRVWQDASFAYDEHGNLTERLKGKRGSVAQVRTRFSWDAAHQLIGSEVTRGPAGAGSTQVFGYRYDALGRRTAKIDAFGTTLFIWDGDRLALERRGGNETLHLYEPGSTVPLAQLHNGSLHYLHTDHLGTPLEASNESGEITWQVVYRTWGSVVIEETAEIPQRLRFQGQYFDVETGLHYNRFRYYDPGPGRFISIDPIGLLGGANGYQYAPNPVEWIDPFGLISQKRDACGKFTSETCDALSGKDYEDKVAEKLSKDPNIEIIGRNVTVFVDNSVRYIDILYRDKKTRQVYAAEVKSNGACRTKDQKKRDAMIDKGKGTFGNNAGNLIGRKTKNVISIVIKIA